MLQRVIFSLTKNLNILTLRSLSSNSSKINVVFQTKNGDFTGKGKIGESLLDVVINNDIPLDGFGACEGTIACCSCHVILDEKHFNRIEKANYEELDMLDLAPNIEDTSRLGCQVFLDKNDEPEVRVRVPDMSVDVRVF
uniref:Adrenodoxin, mitochondrial (inferred by orthology to a human protein) n=1 Tax=Strongyloides venezuelensis TaxID=75913 RepID=A0A0K0G3U7_STRVS